MIAQIRKLKEQREQLNSVLGEFLEEASPWEHTEYPELILAMDRLSKLTNEFMAELECARSEIDRIEKAAADEFVRNYIQHPGK